MTERRPRPYQLPEEEWEKSFLPSPVVARVEERILSSSFTLADETRYVSDELFRLTGRVEVSDGFVGTRLSVAVRCVSSVVFYDQDPPFKGVGLLRYLPKEAMRDLERPRADQLEHMEAPGFFRALERTRKAEEQLDAEIRAESATYERLRRIVVESALWEDNSLHVDLSVVGVAHEWNRCGSLVVVGFGLCSRSSTGLAHARA